jgi:hypothetical protein
MNSFDSEWGKESKDLQRRQTATLAQVGEKGHCLILTPGPGPRSLEGK